MPCSVFAPDPYVRMTLHLIRSHLEAKTVTPTSLIGASGVPYATATRRIGEMIDNGLIDQRPRTRRVRVLVHGDPTFMVMDNLKRRFEQVVGTDIHQRAFSIDRLHQEALKNAERKASRYDIIAVDLPWIGEFAEKDVLMPLDEAIGYCAAGSGRFSHGRLEGRALGRAPLWRTCANHAGTAVLSQGHLCRSRHGGSRNHGDVIKAAKSLHDPARGFYGIAWNAARGTALGHTFLMTMADFGQPVIDIPPEAGGFNTDAGSRRGVPPDDRLAKPGWRLPNI
jgi:multiple sugar transport system substrate-binding protein